jgi:hypothetical protein
MNGQKFDANPKPPAVGICYYNSEDEETAVTQVKWIFSIIFTANLLGCMWRQNSKEILIS